MTFFAKGGEDGDHVRRTKPSGDTITVLSVEHANPTKELAVNIKKGAIFFLGVNGYTTVVPGVTDYDSRFSKNIPVRVIAGTTDAFKNEEEKRLNQIALAYATRYNELLEAYLRAHP